MKIKIGSAILVGVIITLLIIFIPTSSTHYITLTTHYIEGDAVGGGAVEPIGVGYKMATHVVQTNLSGEKTDITDSYPINATIPGPIIRVNQFDTIELTIENELDDGCVSVHTHGLSFDIDSDGTLQSINGVSDQCATVEKSYTYTYYAGNDSVGAWPYHDHTYCNYLLQENTGLSCGVFRGITGAEEIGLYSMIIVEKDTLFKKPVKMDYLLYMADSVQFHGIQLDHTTGIQTALGINPDLEAEEGDNVRFTIIGVGSAFHTFHLHSNKWLDPGTTNYIDTKTVGPMTVHTFEIIAGGYDGGKGDWQYHCHVFDHMTGGMAGIFRVL